MSIILIVFLLDKILRKVFDTLFVDLHSNVSHEHSAVFLTHFIEIANYYLDNFIEEGVSEWQLSMVNIKNSKTSKSPSKMVMITEICMNHSLDFLSTKIFQILIHHHPIKECAYSCLNNRF